MLSQSLTQLCALVNFLTFLKHPAKERKLQKRSFVVGSETPKAQLWSICLYLLKKVE